MSSKDFTIKADIEKILQLRSAGQDLIAYFTKINDKNLRRTITILTNSYPCKIIIPDDELAFIDYMLSSERIIKQENFSEFVRALNIIQFSDNQKAIMIDMIKHNFQSLCENCTFELDNLIIKLFEPLTLFNYMKISFNNSSPEMLQHISDILRHEENLFHNLILDKEFKFFKQKVRQKLS